MLELYHNDMSVCAQKVRIVLAEKQLEWQGIAAWNKPAYLEVMADKGREAWPRIGQLLGR